MNNLSQLLANVLIGILSIIDASSLRNRLYKIKEEHELMWTALDDISRMYPDTDAGQFAKDALKNVEGKYGR